MRDYDPCDAIEWGHPLNRRLSVWLTGRPFDLSWWDLARPKYPATWPGPLVRTPIGERSYYLQDRYTLHTCAELPGLLGAGSPYLGAASFTVAMWGLFVGPGYSIWGSWGSVTGAMGARPLLISTTPDNIGFDAQGGGPTVSVPSLSARPQLIGVSYAPNMTYMYINGVYMGGGALSYAPNFTVGTGAVRPGEADDYAANAGYQVVTLLSDWRLWPRALSAAEHRAVFEDDVAGNPDTIRWLTHCTTFASPSTTSGWRGGLGVPSELLPAYAA